MQLAKPGRFSRFWLNAFMRWFLALATACALAACAASPPGVVDHAFGFDMRGDGQDAEVLDYRYGESKLPVHAPESAVMEGKTLWYESVQGPMLRGDFLYVKWRNRSTGQVYEDTVDLRKRLPANVTDQKVYFMIKGPQLYVYLISLREQRPPDMPPNGPRVYRSLKTITIYPDQPKP